MYISRKRKGGSEGDGEIHSIRVYAGTFVRHTARDRNHYKSAPAESVSPTDKANRANPRGARTPPTSSPTAPSAAGKNRVCAPAHLHQHNRPGSYKQQQVWLGSCFLCSLLTTTTQLQSHHVCLTHAPQRLLQRPCPRHQPHRLQDCHHGRRSQVDAQ